MLPFTGMTYRVVADLVVIVHLAFVLFVAFGALLALRWRWVAWCHIPAAVWGAFVVLTARICPLTPLENRLRLLVGGSTYEGGFIEHYVVAIVYPPGLTRNTQLLLGLLVVLCNTAFYIVVGRRWRVISRQGCASATHVLPRPPR